VQKTGVAQLPLHHGRAPHWLVKRMIKLADEITTIIIDEYGRAELLRRISDPYWFQALGCVLGYDWHSSGVTTVLTGVLKSAMKPDTHGFGCCGGKGKTSRKAPEEIAQVSDLFNLLTSTAEALQYASRMSAKVDNTAIQAGYQLYHHAFFVAESSEWAVVQQGMSAHDRTARRYHWLSEHVQSFVAEPHDAIVGDAKRDAALNMTAKESENCRKVSTDLAKEKPEKLMRLLGSIRPARQTSLHKWMSEDRTKSHSVEWISMPKTLNWKLAKRLYEFHPKDYEELLSLRRVGPATVRGLALIAELVYGASPSWKDPVKYSFAYGGKDGAPYPVDRKAMDQSIEILENAIRNAKMGSDERLKSLQRLHRYNSV